MRNMMVVLGAFVLCACSSDPVTGDWENEQNPNDDMSLYAEGGSRDFLTSGRLSDGTPITLELTYNVDWVRVGNGAYDVEFECSYAIVTVGGESWRGCTDVAQ